MREGSPAYYTISFLTFVIVFILVGRLFGDEITAGDVLTAIIAGAVFVAIMYFLRRRRGRPRE